MANKHPVKPFIKGDSRINRKGRAKKGKTLTDMLKKIGKQRTCHVNGKKVSKAEYMAHIVWIEALEKKNWTAIKMLYNYIDGKPIETIKTQGEETIRIIDDND